MKEILIRRRDLVGAGASVKLQVGQTYRLVVTRSKVDFIEVGDTLLRFNSAVLLPSESTPCPDGKERPGLDVIAACLSYAYNNRAKKLLIAGHTDTVGDDASNVKLSLLRAEAVHGLMTGDRAQFANACYGPHLSQDQRYPNGGDGSKKGVLWDDYQDVLNWVAETFGWPCGYPKGNSTLWDATTKFQKSYNASAIGPAGEKPIKVSGVFDRPTWAAVYDCYEVKLAERLKLSLAELDALRATLSFADPGHRYVGCGEFKTIDEPGRNNYYSQTNRRVEVQFYDSGEEPACPCFSGDCVPARCPLGNPNFYKPNPLPPVLVVPTPLAASWDQPTAPAKEGQERKMIVTGTLLSDGDVVSLEVEQVGYGPIGSVTAVVSGGVATAVWKTWFVPASVPAAAVDLGPGEAFPSVSFRFTVRVKGTSVTSAELLYADELRKRMSFRNGTTADPEDAIDVAYMLCTPWGTKTGRTQAVDGKDGWVLEKQLPPGGVILLLGNSHLDATSGNS